MSQGLCDWLNWIGLIFGFFSFWFAAPEFIGEKRLKEWEMRLANTARLVPQAFFALGVVAIIVGIVAILVGVYLLRKGTNSLHDNSTLINGMMYPIGLLMAVFGVGMVAKMYPIVRRAFLKLFTILANDEQQRQRSLFIGAVLFTASFLMQAIATYPRR
jgi:hypothetical protein